MVEGDRTPAADGTGMESTALLATLQYSDTFFPGGAGSFSWGLETLRAEGHLRGADDVLSFARGQVLHRWSCSDRPALQRAHRCGPPDQDGVAAVDAEVECMALAREMREGSRRGGAAVLTVHDRLGTPGATEYRARVRRGEAPGHLPVVQGLLLRGAGVPERAALAISGHAMVSGLVSAALRLGAIGHLDAQRIVGALRGDLAAALADPPAPLRAFVPAAEIAMMRHEAAVLRVFAN